MFLGKVLPDVDIANWRQDLGVMKTKPKPIDLNQEGLLSVADVPEYLQTRGGRRVHISTIYRWLIQGVSGRKLEAIKIGGQTYTSKQALARFSVTLEQEVGP